MFAVRTSIGRWWLSKVAMDRFQFWSRFGVGFRYAYIKHQTASSNRERTTPESTVQTECYATVMLDHIFEIDASISHHFFWSLFGAYSVTILSLNEQRQVRHSQTTGIKVIQLDRNEETRLIYLDTELVYPVLVSLNLLVTTPNKLPVPPIEDIASLPSTSGGQSPDSNSNSNESDISTIGTTKSSNGSEHSHSDDEN